MKILKEYKGNEFPFEWVNLESYKESKGYRKEIYLIESTDYTTDLSILFFSLFGPLRESIKIYDSSWWDVCLGTWNIDKDAYDYSPIGKSNETAEYLKLLADSNLIQEYSGSCVCQNWDTFIPIIIQCVVSHAAPYSPIFYNTEADLFFYFHHTGSIGLYFKEMNNDVRMILDRAKEEYEIREQLNS